MPLRVQVDDEPDGTSVLKVGLNLVDKIVLKISLVV